MCAMTHAANAERRSHVNYISPWPKRRTMAHTHTRRDMTTNRFSDADDGRPGEADEPRWTLSPRKVSQGVGHTPLTTNLVQGEKVCKAKGRYSNVTGESKQLSALPLTIQVRTVLSRSLVEHVLSTALECARSCGRRNVCATDRSELRSGELGSVASNVTARVPFLHRPMSRFAIARNVERNAKFPAFLFTWDERLTQRDELDGPGDERARRGDETRTLNIRDWTVPPGDCSQEGSSIFDARELSRRPTSQTLLSR